jgi:hypothetical protein
MSVPWSLTLGNRPFNGVIEKIGMDHVSMPEFKGFKYILDARCTFTG